MERRAEHNAQSPRLGKGLGMGSGGGGVRLPWRHSVGKARPEHEPCLRHTPGFRLQGTGCGHSAEAGPQLAAWALLVPRGLEPALTGDARLCFGGRTQHGTWMHFLGTCVCSVLGGGSPEQGPPGKPPPPGYPPRALAQDADLQVGDVPVDVHGGRHAALGDVLVVAGAGLTVHGVDAGDGDALVAASDVSAREGALLLL